jgi:hypothetical protein
MAVRFKLVDRFDGTDGQTMNRQIPIGRQTPWDRQTGVSSLRTTKIDPFKMGFDSFSFQRFILRKHRSFTKLFASIDLAENGNREIKSVNLG